MEQIVLACKAGWNPAAGCAAIVKKEEGMSLRSVWNRKNLRRVLLGVAVAVVLSTAWAFAPGPDGHLPVETRKLSLVLKAGEVYDRLAVADLSGERFIIVVGLEEIDGNTREYQALPVNNIPPGRFIISHDRVLELK